MTMTPAQRQYTRKPTKRNYNRPKARTGHTRHKDHLRTFKQLGHWYWLATSGIVHPDMPSEIATVARAARVFIKRQVHGADMRPSYHHRASGPLK